MDIRYSRHDREEQLAAAAADAKRHERERQEQQAASAGAFLTELDILPACQFYSVKNTLFTLSLMLVRIS